jgi:two-component system NtrC family response regulator
MPLRHAVEYRRERLAHARTKALDLEGIVGSSPSLRRALDSLAEAADGDTTVLITGETGTGKEIFARAIHRNSDRREEPFIVVDCAALPENLVESMLFGYRKGAFTGAERDREGMVKLADGGTLFLDEVGELPPTIQKAFLRVLQEKSFRPVGGEKEVASDFRLVVATNRDLTDMAEEGTFRKDLLFRIRGHAIDLPPLRERGEDAVEIARDLITRLCRRRGQGMKGTTEAFLKILLDYSWPGNVRELNHALERAIDAAADQPVLHPVHLPTLIRVSVARGAVREDLNVPGQGGGEAFPQLKDAKKAAEMMYLRDLMDSTGGDINKACRLANVSRSRLYALLKEHGIDRPA